MATEHLSPIKIFEGIIITVVGGIILFFIINGCERSDQTCPESAAIVDRIFVTVDAKVYWNDTGIQLQKGDCLEFTATGNWWNGISTTEPDGDGGVGSPECLGCPITDANLGELIGRIGNSAPFRIGGTAIHTINQEGVLLLAMNENMGYCVDEREGSCYDDNNGIVDVKITVYRIE